MKIKKRYRLVIKVYEGAPGSFLSPKSTGKSLKWHGMCRLNYEKNRKAHNFSPYKVIGFRKRYKFEFHDACIWKFDNWSGPVWYFDMICLPKLFFLCQNNLFLFYEGRTNMNATRFSFSILLKWYLCVIYHRKDNSFVYAMV